MLFIVVEIINLKFRLKLEGWNILCFKFKILIIYLLFIYLIKIYSFLFMFSIILGFYEIKENKLYMVYSILLLI